jgi:2-polyprenyl-3-methyl-5-hydroxy-6-metoxy-1,4-benzoquinol methylase
MRVDGNRFRRARTATFLKVLSGLPAGKPVRILDVGGTPSYWQAMSDLWSGRDLRFTIVNLDTPSSDDGPYSIRAGNACDLSEYADNAFDVVHSNSVIEHVGHWSEMAAMAREVRRLAPVYYLQTPYFWFPFEPHYRTPIFQWLPETTRAKMLCAKRRGFRGPAKSIDEAMRDIQTVNLLSKAQLRELFPDGRIVEERVLGLTKSITAVRT